MGKCLPSTGCSFYCCKPETLMVSLSFLSYPHHGANTHSLPQWYKMATPPPPKKKKLATPRMNILSRIIAQQVLTYPPTQAFIDGLETQILNGNKSRPFIFLPPRRIRGSIFKKELIIKEGDSPLALWPS